MYHTISSVAAKIFVCLIYIWKFYLLNLVILINWLLKYNVKWITFPVSDNRNALRCSETPAIQHQYPCCEENNANAGVTDSSGSYFLGGRGNLTLVSCFHIVFLWPPPPPQQLPCVLIFYSFKINLLIFK